MLHSLMCCSRMTAFAVAVLCHYQGVPRRTAARCVLQIVCCVAGSTHSAAVVCVALEAWCCRGCVRPAACSDQICSGCCKPASQDLGVDTCAMLFVCLSRQQKRLW